MDAPDPRQFRPEKTAPVRSDPPGAVTAMPSPREMHHVHIFADEKYDEMVAFYQWLFNGEVIRVNPNGLTFISYDDHDHRVVIIRREGGAPKPAKALGVSHLAFAYASLGELLYVYKRMKERGHRPVWTVNHGNSTSFYYEDPDGNTVETMMDNYPAQQTQDYKRHYQWSEYFGEMSEGSFDPDKMLALYESGVPDTTLIDREEVRRMVREGTRSRRRACRRAHAETAGSRPRLSGSFSLTPTVMAGPRAGLRPDPWADDDEVGRFGVQRTSTPRDPPENCCFQPRPQF